MDIMILKQRGKKMSTIEERRVACAMCNGESTQYGLGSWCVFGEPDLDFRPAAMLRATMNYWIECRPKCGYAATSISKKPRISREDYDALLKRAALEIGNKKRSHFTYCVGLQYEKRQKKKEALRFFLAAAWMCDDDENEQGALSARKKCMALIEPRLERGTIKNRRRYTRIYCDLLRRTRDKRILKFEPRKNVLDFKTAQILNFERKLYLQEDFSAHSIDEVYTNDFDDFFEKNEPLVLSAEEIRAEIENEKQV